MRIRLSIIFSAAFISIAASEVNGQAAVWSQCGGVGFSGPAVCVTGWTCVYLNQYYSQCIPNTPGGPGQAPNYK
ncbi:hypothetical protein GALMADRAFT_223501 [Galerina marginata CBS 339.88]|uniref:CBM1 domain-containing protein n=1 Tax=Galerina marginata (strain CBS 339.88) TaxID=685588 RepID=A0A067TJW7_GALM3|nr:hypothetical protein GALMADRAFT_223501 [Galerina marginata CBS 339.88]